MVLTSGVENTPTWTAHLFTYLSCYLSLRLSVQSPRSNTFYETLTYFLKKNFQPYTLSRIREVMSRFFYLSPYQWPPSAPGARLRPRSPRGRRGRRRSAPNGRFGG